MLVGECGFSLSGEVSPGWIGHTERVSHSIFSSDWDDSGSWWLTLGRTVTRGPPPWMEWRKFHVSSEICPESAPEGASRIKTQAYTNPRGTSPALIIP